MASRRGRAQVGGVNTGYGEPWTKPASCSMSWSNAAATNRPPSGCRAAAEEADAAARVMITDKLASYGAAKRDINAGRRASAAQEVERRQHKRLNNRAEN